MWRGFVSFWSPGGVLGKPRQGRTPDFRDCLAPPPSWSSRARHFSTVYDPGVSGVWVRLSLGTVRTDPPPPRPRSPQAVWGQAALPKFVLGDLSALAGSWPHLPAGGLDYTLRGSWHCGFWAHL